MISSDSVIWIFLTIGVSYPWALLPLLFNHYYYYFFILFVFICQYEFLYISREITCTCICSYFPAQVSMMFSIISLL